MVVFLFSLIMVVFKTVLKKYGDNGEKTNWTYIDIPAKIAEQIKPGCKKSFRVKGKIDNCDFNAVATIPIGEGNFIVPINATIRKSIKKIHGATVEIQIKEDLQKLMHDEELMTCLNDEPSALNFFKSLPTSHQNWFSNWVKSARTAVTKTKRITIIIVACAQQMSFPEMMKKYKNENNLIQ